MNTTLTTIARRLSDLAFSVASATSAFRAADYSDRNTPRRGRKTVRTFEEIVSSIGLTKPLLAVAEANPVAAYVALANLRRPLTDAEVLEVASARETTREGGQLPNGDPQQCELFIQTPVRISAEDFEGRTGDELDAHLASLFAAEVRRIISMLRPVAATERTTIYVRYQRNAIIRSAKSAGKAALAQAYGGRLYGSDSPNHGGWLLAVLDGTELAKNNRLADVRYLAPGIGD